jgi:hypothetical protein
MLKNLLLVTAAMFITSCASNNAKVQYTAKYDFYSIQSYYIYPRDSNFAEQQNIDDALRNMIELTIENTLEKHSFSYESNLKPDVIVTYYLTGRDYGAGFEKQKVTEYCWQCPLIQSKNKRQTKIENKKSASQHAQSIKTLNFDDKDKHIGSLIISMINPNTGLSIWKSSYKLNVKEQDNSEVVQDKIRTAVGNIIDLFMLNNRS